MEKVYSPAAIEQRLYQHWEAAGYFAPRPAARSYCIVIPPPNVTGTLHMGHAFQDTIMDALIRLHRMRGEQTLWQVGTDHAGIATQMVVERQLDLEGKRRTDLTRDAFIERVWAWKQQSGSTIAQQLRRLGASVDWARERFTMDPDLSGAVVEAFVRLHQEGLIYRGQRLVNWDPVLGTALSDLEVLSEEEDGHLWHVRYRLADGTGQVVVATTRPETMLGDAAVAVHPDDERYRALVGRKLLLPLSGREIPIIADSYVDPAFGTGCLKITPAHDFNDYAIGMRHGLPLINIFTRDARLNENAPAHLRGLDRFQARERIVAELDAAGLLERIEPHKLMIPRGDRTGAVIEPYLTDQWYVRIAPLAAPAIAAVESGRVRFVPENWDKTFFQWMRNIQDWCISRQLWWGHRIPAWYDEDGEIYVARSAAEAHAQARARHGREVPLRQDDDVLDTWFSSALWPFSTLGWPEQSPRARALLPDRRAGHRIRHHLFLGRAHADVRAEVHGRGAVSGGVPARPDPRCRWAEDVQVQGQRHRSAGHHRWHRSGSAGGQAHRRTDAAAPCRRHRTRHAQAIPQWYRRLRHRCAAFYLRLVCHPEPRAAFRSGPRRRLPQFLQQAVERGALRNAGGAGGGGARGRSLDRCRAIVCGRHGH